MCGLVAIIQTSGNPCLTTLKEMTDVIAHRGPDGEGHFLENNIGFGHRRLAILDLSDAGHQPMHYRNRYTIVYNGEIYNYRELKSELVSVGYIFKSSTDTEVILAAYDYWKEKCLNKFNGMWAFVIFDRVDSRVFISRDRFGIKPLYFYKTDNLLVFASEIKSILRHPDVVAKPNEKYLTEYIKSGPKEYVSETAFYGIFRFPFASYVYIQMGTSALELNPTVFWNFSPNISRETFCPRKAKAYADEYYSILKDAVMVRLRADVKVGSALSGGLDSSSIVYLINNHFNEIGSADKQETFSSVYRTLGTEYCDESKYINLLSEKLGVKTNQIEPIEQNVPDELEKVVSFMENPPESTCMSAWYTFKVVRSKCVVVTLDGQGADEQLAGYPFYILSYFLGLNIIELYREVRFYLTPPFSKRTIFCSFLLAHLRFIVGFPFTRWLVRRFTNIDLRAGLNQMLAHSMNTSLITLIHYADRLSMGHSVESRMPFMDYRLVEFLASVPACYKIHRGWSKYVARLAFDKKLPDEICWRRDKMGWQIPEAQWFSTGLKYWMGATIYGCALLKRISSARSLKAAVAGDLAIRRGIRYLNVALFERYFFSKNHLSLTKNHN
jgi:asparagine synthase (glutamine-hydrolysing)